MKPAKILIVDDEKDIRDSLTDFLSPRIHCEIIHAENTYEAITKIENEHMDLILLDINMPGISGIDVIRKVNERSGDTDVIVLTKLDSSTLAHQIEELGAMYIPKPFSLRIVYDETKKRLEAMNKFLPKNNS